MMNAAPEKILPELRLRSVRPLKFLVFPLGWVLAHVGRTVEIAKVLRAQGHEVVFAGEDPHHPKSRLDHALAAGFRVVHAKEPSWHYAWERFHKYGGIVGLYDFLRSQSWAPLDEILEDILRVCQDEDPDLILGDMSVGVSTAGYILKKPAAGIMNAYNTHFFRPWSVYRTFLQAWDKLRLSPIRERVFRKYGVKPVNSFELLRSMPLLGPDLPRFHQPHGDYPNWHAIGPILSEPPSSLPAWYDELDDGQTNIYITMGSTGLLEPLLLRSYSALGRSPYRFVVTTGGQVSDEAMAAAPPNFRFTKYAPGSQILKHCAAIVFHGGNGTMYQALAAGVPMVALPSHLEQEVCVDIALKQGFGLRQCARRITGKQLLDSVGKVLADPSYRTNALAYRDEVRSSRAAEKAASMLVAQARQGRPVGAALDAAENDNVVYFPARQAESKQETSG